MLLAIALVALSGCGGDEKRTSGFEGEFIDVGNAVYQVELTRLLNSNIRPDDQLLRGQAPAPSSEQYLAVFLQIDNEGKQPYQPPRGMKVVDTVGNEYLPLDATQSGFALDFGEPIEPNGKAPPNGSPAAEGSTGSAMVLFRVKTQSAQDNLPLELEIPVEGEDAARIELDV
jgi:hypothetical protein